MVLNNKRDLMSDILASYGIKCAHIGVDQGVNVDVYSIRLAMGCRFGRVDSVLVDIGMQLRSYAAPMGFASTSDGAYKISVQKSEIKSRPISSILNEGYLESNFLCPIVIGVAPDEEPIVVDLAKMPNLLIGGIPGSGKSMLLHSIILSCICNGADIYLCDPKLVEFSKYKNVSLVKSIAYGIDDFRIMCSSIIKIMNDRYSVISASRAKDFSDFNKNIKRNFLFKQKALSPIVIVVDEWADIYLNDKSIEGMVCSIAQKGRAAGVYLVMATQRPSSKVVSGLVKASFPGRIALRTSTAVDSRVIIEQSGAEKMVDPGSGLYRDAYSFTPRLFRAPIVTSNCIDMVLETVRA
jgi:S-DNA-T family DNA segregation ATPase FtsK/SpoIIIE